MLRLLEDDELQAAGVVSGHERAVVILHDAESDEAMTALRGFDDDLDVALVLFEHMRAILRAHGKDATIVQLGRG